MTTGSKSRVLPLMVEYLTLCLQFPVSSPPIIAILVNKVQIFGRDVFLTDG